MKEGLNVEITDYILMLNGKPHVGMRGVEKDSLPQRETTAKNRQQLTGLSLTRGRIFPARPRMVLQIVLCLFGFGF